MIVIILGMLLCNVIILNILKNNTNKQYIIK